MSDKIKEPSIKFLSTQSLISSDYKRLSAFMEMLTPEGRDYLADFSTRLGISDFKKCFDEIHKKKVLVLGEAIIDEYQFCNAMNKSNKEPVLAVKLLHGEKYAGGTLAIANHLSGFCKEVGILTGVGEDSSLNFIEKNLAANVKRHFLIRKESPTIIKRRFVEEYLNQKLFETYFMENECLSLDEENELNSMINSIAPEYDIVIVADYGHGLMRPSIIRNICDKAKFLSVNTQTNAGNKGYNHITKYPRADYIAIDAPEARMEARDLDSDMRDVISTIMSKIDCPRLTVTQGKFGCTISDMKSGFTTIPAFAMKIVDRVGAGDAFLAFSSCFTAIGCDAEMTGFIGNVAGAEACASMGNKKSITPESLFAHIAFLLN